ncbi:MAG: TldD/PmbA family protein [candidate division Zixibacteria bacterium]|nr:TldD/PmbA family protein [candidate division Zixibacteria bacterium]
MINQSHAMEVLYRALKHSAADQTEAVLMSEKTDLTRFAESTINQNISQEETTLVITAVNEKKVGIATTNDLSNDGIKKAVESAVTISKLQKPDERFVSFPDKEMAPKLDKTVTVEANLDFTPADMAEVVLQAAKEAKVKNLTASGAFRHDINTVAVANSLGVEQFGRFGKSELSLTISGEGEQSGYGIAFSPDPSKIDYSTAIAKAVDIASRNINPIVLPDGQYTVILEPAAVGQLLLFLSFLGFGGRTMAQRRSFLSGKTGELITGEKISISDEADNPIFGTLLFDYEGVPKKRITPIKNGTAGEGAFDSYYANLMQTQPTGHSVQPNNGFGPYPKHMVMQPGDKTIEEMIASTEKGVLITHFWYINYLNPMRTMITGTTFDGTFLIENGQVGSAIKNMRTNQSILEAFSNAEMLSKERIVYPQYASLMQVPAMKINNFNLVQETKEEWEGSC